MRTSAQNPIAPTREITPDLVAQKDITYGVTVEAKRTLSNNPDHWERTISQLRKYDDSLIGWWTHSGLIPDSNAILLIHHSRSRRLTKFIDEAIKTNPSLIGNSTVVVEFNLSREAEDYIFFRREWRTLADKEFDAALEAGVPVPLLRVLESYPNIQFYDQRPPMPLLLMLLWTDLFVSLASPKNYDEDLKATPVDVSVDRIAMELQQAYGSGALARDARSGEFPRKSWIRDALEFLVAKRMAIPGRQQGTYTILYHSIRGDVLERFITLTHTPTQSGQREKEEQGTLFPQNADENSSD